MTFCTCPLRLMVSVFSTLARYRLAEKRAMPEAAGYSLFIPNPLFPEGFEHGSKLFFNPGIQLTKVTLDYHVPRRQCGVRNHPDGGGFGKQLLHFGKMLN